MRRAGSTCQEFATLAVMTWFAIVAMAFYALEIAITDARLSSVPPRMITLYYSAGVAVFAFISLLVSREQITAPTASTSTFLVLMILASFVAASAHFEAINQGIGTARLTLVYAFLPIAGAVYSAIFKKEVPSVNLIIACVLAGVALYLVSITQKPLSLKP